MTPMPTRNLGFTLTELAVVLAIVALLLGGMLLPLTLQDDVRRSQDTQKLMGEVRDALLGFAAANGRLPCPASAASNGYESFCAESTGQPYTNCTVLVGGTFPAATPYRCAAPYNGFVPATTLGLGPVDPNRLLLDAWGHPLRYAVAIQSDELSPPYDFTTPDGLRNRGLSNLNPASPYHPDLMVCDGNAGISNAGTANGAVANLATCTAGLIAGNAAAVIYSLGRNDASSNGGTGSDERHNPNPRATITPDRVFVSHTPTPADAANGEFDDLMIWLSPNILYNRMIAAGRLP